MTHTFVFYARPGRVPDPGRVVAFLTSLPFTRAHGEGQDRAVRYENPFTGVDCTWQWSLEGEERLPEWAPTGLELRVDYLRPRFFAREVLELACTVAAHLDLAVRDPEAGGPPAPPALEELLASWEAGNRRAVWTLCTQEHLELWAAPQARLEAWWRAAAAWPALRERYGEALEGPPLLVAVDGEVGSLTFWGPGEPGVFPLGLDFVLLRRRRRWWLLRVEETGLVPLPDLLAALEPALVREERPVPHFRLAAPGTAHGRASLAALRLRTRVRFTRILPTEVVDAEVVEAGPPDEGSSFSRLRLAPE